MELAETLIDCFRINNRMNLYLIDGILPAWLDDKAGGKGRSVGEQLAHIHKVRLMWLQASAPELLKDPGKAEKTGITHESLKSFPIRLRRND